MAGICGVATILMLGLFSVFSILQVAMQLQRKEIGISYKRDVFAKLVTGSLAGNFNVTLPKNSLGSSTFCKGLRTSNV